MCTMRVEVDLTDGEREAVKRYANKEGYKMSRAYAELIRQMLTLEVSADFDREESMAVRVETCSWSTYAPVMEERQTGEVLLSNEYAPLHPEENDE